MEGSREERWRSQASGAVGGGERWSREVERVESGRMFGTLFFLVYVQCYSALWWSLGDRGLTVVLVKNSIVLMHSLVSTLFVCELSFGQYWSIFSFLSPQFLTKTTRPSLRRRIPYRITCAAAVTTPPHMTFTC